MKIRLIVFPSFFQVGIGICMDLNPYKFKDFSAFEFATFHRKERTKIILCPMNWLDSNPSPPTSKQRKTPANTQEDSENNSVSESVAWSSLEYWERRLEPLCIEDEETGSNIRSEVIFASCNRFGTENGKYYNSAAASIMHVIP